MPAIMRLRRNAEKRRFLQKRSFRAKSTNPRSGSSPPEAVAPIPRLEKPFVSNGIRIGLQNGLHLDIITFESHDLTAPATLLAKLMEAFPRLYFFVPALPPVTYNFGKTTILLTEPADAILWLMDMLAEGSSGDCAQGDLENLVRRWW